METPCAFRSSIVGKNGAISKKGNFVWSGKIACVEAFQDLLKSCVSFGGSLEGSNEEKMGRQQKEELLEWNVGKGS